MKICIITPQYGHLWSGIGTYATNLINCLSERGHEVTVICPKTPTPMHRCGGRVASEMVHPKVRIVDMKDLKIKPTLGNWFILSYYFNKTLKGLLERESFDIIHFADARDSLFCRVKGIPVVGTMHDYYFVEASRNPFYYRKYYSDWFKRWLFYNFTRFMEKRVIRGLSFVITNTDYVRKSLINNYYINESSVKTIYYGIKLDESAKLGGDKLKGNPSILFIGGNFQRKGLPLLIRAIADVKNVLPDVSLYVVGRDSKEEDMRRLSRMSGVEGNIHFSGWRDNKEVRGLFKRVDIFAMPSMIEGFGLVFLESMSAGTPVIGGDTGGTPELIEDGTNGFLVKHGDWQDLSKKIQLLAGDKIFMEKLVQNGYKTFERFTLNRMVGETIGVYLAQRKNELQ